MKYLVFILLTLCTITFGVQGQQLSKKEIRSRKILSVTESETDLRVRNPKAVQESYKKYNRQGEIIERKHLPPTVCPLEGVDQTIIGQPRTLKQMESVLIIEALRRNKGNQTAASKDLGIDKSTLYRKLKAYNIKPQAYR